MEKKKPVAGDNPCPECRGSGHQAMGCNLFPCPECGGTGVEKGGEKAAVI